MMNIILFLFLVTFSSCRTFSPIFIPVSFGPREDVPQLTDEDKKYLESLTEKQDKEVSDCQYLGEVTGKGRGGLSGRWQAMKNVKIEAAKNRADTVVFGPVPKWELTETFYFGKYYRCKNISDISSR